MSQTESIVQYYKNSLDWSEDTNYNKISDENSRFTLYDSYFEEYNNLSYLEKEILSIAKTILKKKKYPAELIVDQIELASPLIEQLYAKCIAKLHYSQDIPKEDIFTTIQVLVRTKWMVSGQRRTRHEILENDIFQKILKFIESHPGTYSRDPAVESELHITKSPFLKHIKVLSAFSLIRKKKTGNKTNFFLTDMPDTYDDLAVLFSNSDLTKTIFTVKSMDRCNISEVARQLNTYRGTIQYNVKKLLESGVFIKEADRIAINNNILSEYNQIYQSPAFF